MSREHGAGAYGKMLRVLGGRDMGVRDVAGMTEEGAWPPLLIS